MATLAVAIALANFGLSAVLGESPRLLRREVVYSPSEFDRIAEQVAAAERSRNIQSPRSASLRKPLVLVVGLSTAREDIDPSVIGPAVCGGSQLLNLGSSGGSFSELSYYLRTLDRSQLRPDAILLAVHPVWMTTRIALPDSSSGAWQGVAKIHNPDDVVRLSRLTLHSLWIQRNRNAIHTLLTNQLLRLRWVFTAPFGLALPALVPISSTDPWAPRFSYSAPHADRQFLDAQMRSWKALGWFDPDSYATRGPEADAVIAIAERSLRMSPQSLVVLMPESSALRANAPPAAEMRLRGALAEGGFGFPVLDFRAAIPDSAFYDYAHLNALGRRRFSRSLATTLRRMVACRQQPV